MSETSSVGGAKTSPAYWDAGWTVMPRPRFWSPFDPVSSHVHRFLAREIPAGASVLELGFAPGKLLSWLALRRGAKVSGVDYSTQGVGLAVDYFRQCGIAADLRAEDAFATSFEPDSFDCVMSHGLIEHFDDPRPIVAKHVELVRPGGKVIVSVPNYGGFYGRIQQRLDPENLAVHNTAIMSPAGLEALFEGLGMASLRTFYGGRPTLWGLSIHRKMHPKLALNLRRAAALAARFLPYAPARLRSLVWAIGVKAGPER